MGKAPGGKERAAESRGEKGRVAEIRGGGDGRHGTSARAPAVGATLLSMPSSYLIRSALICSALMAMAMAMERRGYTYIIHIYILLYIHIHCIIVYMYSILYIHIHIYYYTYIIT